MGEMTDLKHKLLPPEAMAELQRAAAVEPTHADPLRRQKAIEAATARLRLKYPGLFREP
jgi:hypothetical protein